MLQANGNYRKNNAWNNVVLNQTQTMEHIGIGSNTILLQKKQTWKNSIIGEYEWNVR